MFKKILPVLVLLVFSGCLSKPQLVEKSKKQISVNKIENIKVVWVNKKFRYSLHQFQSGYGNMQDSIKPTDKVFSYNEVSEKFSLIGAETAKKLQKCFGDNNIPFGEQYILEITPRQASIDFRKGGSESMAGSFMLMGALKSIDGKEKDWFTKMDIYLLFNNNENNISERDNKVLDNFASEVIEQMKSDGLVK